ncbi:Mu transposase C-terminal domain-containing protein [Herbaspirillum sp.]|uniref:Mu transposase C-terminal domain-containing protein n=1 Tax=Herbaspirillum sp. TaxID=1890675 RepID=UPI0031DAAF90
MITQPPQSFSLQPGLHFRHSTLANETVIVEHVSPVLVVVKELTNGSTHQIPAGDFHRLFSKGEIYPLCVEDANRSVAQKRPPGAKDQIAPISGLIEDKSEAEKKQGFKKLAYREELLRTFKNLRPTEKIEEQIEVIRKMRGDKKAPSAWTIYRCDLAISEAGGNVGVAFPNYADRGGPGQFRMEVITLNALKGTLQEVRKSNGRILYSDIYDEVERKLIIGYDNEAPMLQPSYSTVRRHTDAVISSIEKEKRNKGDKQAKRKYAEWSRRARAIAPLQRFECDDKNTGVFGVCGRTGLPTGRIWISVVLDQYSRMPMGHVVSGRAPNLWTALGALINAIMPKDMSLPAMKNVKSEVPFCGLPARVIFDNALQNHAQGIDAAIVTFSNIGTSYAEPYSPRQKSGIEGYFCRTVKEFLADLPGFVGPKLSRDFIQNAYDGATVTTEDYEQAYSMWVYDEYANKPGGDGYSPMQLWSEGMLGRQPRFPSDVNRMRLAAMPIVMRKLRPEGIRFHDLVYWHDGLSDMIKHGWIGKDVIFKYDPNDLRRVWFRDPLGKSVQWYPADSDTLEYTAGLTMYQHRAVKRIAWHNKIKNPSRKQYVQCKAALREWVRKLRWSKKMQDRSEAQILTIKESTPPLTTIQTVQMGELEATLNDLKKDVAPEMALYEQQRHQDLGEHMWSFDEDVD